MLQVATVATNESSQAASADILLEVMLSGMEAVCDVSAMLCEASHDGPNASPVGSLCLLYRLYFNSNVRLHESISHGWQGLLRLYDAAAPHKRSAQFARFANFEITVGIAPRTAKPI